jgi:iron complex transport system substrate-binding protein
MKRLAAIFLSVIMIITLFASCTSTGANTASVGESAESTGVSYAGTYHGTATGYHGDVSVTVELDNTGKIVSIVVDDGHSETEGVGSIAIEKVPDSILESQSLAVDGVTGATVTSNAIIAAVANALESAGLDPAAYGYVPAVVEDELNVKFNPDSMPKKQPVTDTITVTDVKGREVSIELPISTYAMSTMDVIDYMIPLLGEDAFNKLVASGQDGGGGIERYAKLYMPIVGTYMEHFGQISEHNAPFDLEMILAMDPDVLIVNSAMQAHKYALEIEPQLTKAGIPIVLIDVPGKSVDTSAQQTLTLLGQIFQVEGRAAEVVDFLDEQYAMIASMNLDEADKPTVYYEKSASAEIFGSTSSSKSGWGALIALAGGDNIADPILLDSAAAQGSSNTLDPEYVIEANPEFVITSGGSWMDNYGSSKPKPSSFDVVNRTGWNELKAVKDSNVYGLAHAMSRSIYSFYAVIELASWFHPEKFSNIDKDAIIDEFFDRFMLTDSTITVWTEKVNEVAG